MIERGKPHFAITQQGHTYKTPRLLLDRPACGQYLGLFQHGPRRPFLLVGRVAMLTQNALAQAAQVGADILAQRPVDGHVVAVSHSVFTNLAMCFCNRSRRAS